MTMIVRIAGTEGYIKRRAVHVDSVDAEGTELNHAVDIHPKVTVYKLEDLNEYYGKVVVMGGTDGEDTTEYTVLLPMDVLDDLWLSIGRVRSELLQKAGLLK